MTPDPLLDLTRDLNRRQEPYALITVVRAVAPTSAYLGAQAIVLSDGSLHGWIGGGCAKDVVIGAARQAIVNGTPKLVRISNDQLQSDADVEQHSMTCASNGTIELFIQPYGPQSAICVLGDTPAAQEARFLAERLRIRLVDSPDAAPIVLVATQGQGDEEALERALLSRADHVLMIASRKKADRLREVMRTRGVSAEQIDRLVAPVGPDAGAKTPQEIAMVSIVGVMAYQRGRAARPATAQPVVAKVAEKFINPVCGMAIDIATAKHVETLNGVDYYFCCDGCLTTFRQNPAKYAISSQHREEAT